MPPRQGKDEPKRLKPVWSYSTSYPTDDAGGEKSIHAYSSQAEGRKDQFLRDARALLKAVGEELRAYGFTEHEYDTNPAGVAVSGSVSAYFRQPGLDKYLYLTADETCVRVPLAEPPEVGHPLNTMCAMTTRADGVMLLARWCLPAGRKGRGYTSGPNTYLDPNQNSRELAPALLPLADICPLRLPEREATQGSFFDLAA